MPAANLQLFTGNVTSLTGFYHRLSVWANSAEEAAQKAAVKAPDRTWTVLRSRPFRWSDGKLLFCHAEQTAEAADHEANNYRSDRRNGGTWSVRVFPRTVRAGGYPCSVWVVIVRHKFEVAHHAS